MNISVIIPAADPDANLAVYIKNLIQNKIEDIIIVSSAADEALREFAQEAGAYPQVTVITESRSGRGAALKAAFRFLSENRPDCDGAVCTFADGRYPYRSVEACIKAFEDNPGHVIIGKRDFSGGNIPALKRIGLSLSSHIYRFGMGIKLSDTQSSLRLVPAEYFGFFSSLPGDGAGYETRMLTGIVNSNIPYAEVSADAVCVSAKKSENFSSLKDKIIIYGIVLTYFIKFALSSVSSYLIDMGVYAVLLALLQNTLGIGSQVLICTVVSRTISSIFNYIINRKTVFRSTDNFAGTTVKYYVLVLIKLAASYGLIYLITYILNITGFVQLIVKALVDIVLFVFSFYFQRIWVFKNKKA